MIGKKEEVGRPILYGTTPEFLRTFSLRDLTELPTLREFHELGEAEKAQGRRQGRCRRGAGRAGGAAAARRRPAIREPDPEEDDELLGELDRANAAAAKATAPPPETVPEADLGPRARLFRRQVGRNSGPCACTSSWPRRACRRAARPRRSSPAGAVRVNGVVVNTLGSNVDARARPGRGDGRAGVPETPIYRLLLKPRACLATLAAERRAVRRWRATCATRSRGWQVVSAARFSRRGRGPADHRRRARPGDRPRRRSGDDLPRQAAGR